MENLQKYEDEIDNCFQEIEELKNALYSKDKLVSIIHPFRFPFLFFQIRLKCHFTVDLPKQFISV